MILDYSPRRSGKTTRLLNWIAKDPRRLLIVHDSHYAQILRDEKPELAKQICAWSEYMNTGSGFRIHFTSVSLDNADMILENLVRLPVHFVSMSDNDHNGNLL